MVSRSGTLAAILSVAARLRTSVLGRGRAVVSPAQSWYALMLIDCDWSRIPNPRALRRHASAAGVKAP
jgi:hypothetical protein